MDRLLFAFVVALPVEASGCIVDYAGKLIGEKCALLVTYRLTHSNRNRSIFRCTEREI